MAARFTRLVTPARGIRYATLVSRLSLREAVNNLSEDLRSNNPQLPWRQIAGTRDKMIHDYLGVDVELIWNVARTLLPELRTQVRVILSSLESKE